MNRRILSLPVLAALILTMPTLVVTGSSAESVDLMAYEIAPETWCEIRDEWVADLLATHEPGTWAPIEFKPTDAQLAKLKLPPREHLEGRIFSEPTMVYPDGTTQSVSLPAVASFAGTGCFGIRPGAFLLLLDDGVGWCSMAHVYGNPGGYKISTAGHCGRGGDHATVIAALSNDFVPILLTFGKFSKSTDGGIGNDYATISIDSEYQHLVSPTMCFWGGPLGLYEEQGSVVGTEWPRRQILPTVTVDPNPDLVQTIVHYGHGLGLGPGGTPRLGEAIVWDSHHYAFFGAISPGDSGSGSNALGGDELTSANEAAGINTHIYVDPSLKTGLGYLAGTRSTRLGEPAHGQIVPYPVPFPLGP